MPDQRVIALGLSYRAGLWLRATLRDVLNDPNYDLTQEQRDVFLAICEDIKRRTESNATESVPTSRTLDDSDKRAKHMSARMAKAARSAAEGLYPGN